MFFFLYRDLIRPVDFNPLAVLLLCLHEVLPADSVAFVYIEADRMRL